MDSKFEKWAGSQFLTERERATAKSAWRAALESQWQSLSYLPDTIKGEIIISNSDCSSVHIILEECNKESIVDLIKTGHIERNAIFMYIPPMP